MKYIRYPLMVIRKGKGRAVHPDFFKNDKFTKAEMKDYLLNNYLVKEGLHNKKLLMPNWLWYAYEELIWMRFDKYERTFHFANIITKQNGIKIDYLSMSDEDIVDKLELTSMLLPKFSDDVKLVNMVDSTLDLYILRILTGRNRFSVSVNKDIYLEVWMEGMKKMWMIK